MVDGRDPEDGVAYRFVRGDRRGLFWCQCYCSVRIPLTTSSHNENDSNSGKEFQESHNWH